MIILMTGEFVWISDRPFKSFELVRKVLISSFDQKALRNVLFVRV